MPRNQTAATERRVHTMHADVVARREVTVQWNAAANRLRIAVTSNDETVAVFGRDEIYGLSAGSPQGTVIIRATEALVDVDAVVDSLVRTQAARLVEKRTDARTGAKAAIVEVLLESI